MLFEYKVLDKFGNNLINTIESDSRDNAIRKLKAQGFVVSRIKPVRKHIVKEKIAKLFNTKATATLSSKQRVDFYNELLSLRKNGIKELHALEHIRDNDILPQNIRTIAGLVFSDMEKGKTFYDALKERGFPEQHTQIIKTGITTGKTIETLTTLLKKEDMEQKLSRGIASILAYPIVMFIIIFIATIACAVYITPLNKKAIDSIVLTGGMEEYPPVSKVAFWISDNIWWIAGGSVGLVVLLFGGGYLLAKKHHGFRRFASKMFGKIPFFGTFAQFKDYATLTSLMALIIGAGYKQEDAVYFCKSQINNTIVKDQFEQIALLVGTGGYTVSQAMQTVGFNKTITTVIKRGEISGREEVVNNLNNIADSFTNSALHYLSLIEKSSEFINMIVVYVAAIPVLIITLGPQLEQIMLMTQLM
jgi:type II secretory pathway component PulF